MYSKIVLNAPMRTIRTGKIFSFILWYFLSIHIGLILNIKAKGLCHF